MTDSTPSLSRRGFLGGAAAVGLSALGLAGCGSGTGTAGSATGGGGSGGGKTLQWWSFDEGRVAIARRVTQSAAFKQLHPDVTVQFQQFTWAQMHDKLLAALVSGRGVRMSPTSRSSGSRSSSAAQRSRSWT
jgi:ABC-type glycerol-3-phosphate transport system substrate-binding protein